MTYPIIKKTSNYFIQLFAQFINLQYQLKLLLLTMISNKFNRIIRLRYHKIQLFISSFSQLQLMIQVKQAVLEENIQKYEVILPQLCIQQLDERDYVSLYQGFLDNSQVRNTLPSNIISTFLEKGIKYNQNEFYEAIQIKILQFTNNYEVIILAISYGKFKFHIKVININEKSPINNKDDCIEGGFGFVYNYNQGDISVAIKFIKIQDNLQIGLREIIKEYLLLAVASAMKIGPKLVKFFGFDIVIFRDYFAFSMEHCEMSNFKINKSLVSLKQKLNLLHKLNIVHLDIKPDNIGFSPSFDQYVFIDFGLSRMIKQQINMKTYTNFVGSFNFCSPQMLQLYLQEMNGFVNLYYNDAFCLNKSLKKIQQQSQQISNPRQFLSNKVNKKKLKAISQKLKLKMSFLKVSLKLQSQWPWQHSSQQCQQLIIQAIKQNHSSQANLSQFHQLKDKSSIIFKHFLCYAQNNLFNPFFKEDILIPKFNQRRTISFFQQRFQLIQRLKYYKKRETINMDIFNIQNAEKLKYTVYKSLLIQFIRINNEVLQFQQKVKACLVYKELFLKNIGTIKDMALYKQTVKHIFESTIQSFNQQQAYQILLNSLQSVIILELVDQQKLVRAFQYIIESQFKLICKLNSFFKFFRSLQFIKEKYRTIYNYDRLMNTMTKKLIAFIGKSQSLIYKQDQQELVKQIKKIVNYKEKIQNNHFHKIGVIEKFHFDRIYSKTDEKIELKRLFYNITLYIFGIYAQAYIQNMHQGSPNLIGQILYLLNMSQNITYLDFYLYNQKYMQNQSYINNQIYQLFVSKFKDFQEHKYFKIYIMNSLKEIKQREIKIKSIHYQSDRTEAHQVFIILDQTIKASSNFHQYLRYFFILITIENSVDCMDLIQKLILQNREKITQLSLSYNHLQNQFQENLLRKEAFVINNIFSIMSMLVSEEQFLEKAEYFIQSCQLAVHDMKCWKCKVEGLLQIYKVYANIIRIKGNEEQSFLLLIDLIVLFIKHRQFTDDALSLLTVNLLFLWVNNKYLHQKYDIRVLIYEIIITKQAYIYCLVDLRFYNIFVDLYYFLEQINDLKKMLDFFKTILKGLYLQNSAILIQNFYYSWRQIVVRNKKINQFLSFHQFIAQYFLNQIRNNSQRQYYSLYFSHLLLVELPLFMGKRILLMIAESINSLDKCPKILILNHYYRHFKSCFKNMSQRKDKYLCLKHMKNCFDKFPLKFAISKKLKSSNNKFGISTKKITSLQLFIKKYHQNIGNIL